MVGQVYITRHDHRPSKGGDVTYMVLYVNKCSYYVLFVRHKQDSERACSRSGRGVAKGAGDVLPNNFVT